MLTAPQHLDAIEITPGERIDKVLGLSDYRVGDELTAIASRMSSRSTLGRRRFDRSGSAPTSSLDRSRYVEI